MNELTSMQKKCIKTIVERLERVLYEKTESKQSSEGGRVRTTITHRSTQKRLKNAERGSWIILRP